jgi:hypothetical protein
MGSGILKRTLDLTSSAMYATLFKPNFRLEVSSSGLSLTGFLGTANLVSCILLWGPFERCELSESERKGRDTPSSSSAYQHDHGLSLPFYVPRPIRGDWRLQVICNTGCGCIVLLDWRGRKETNDRGIEHMALLNFPIALAPSLIRTAHGVDSVLGAVLCKTAGSRQCDVVALAGRVIDLGKYLRAAFFLMMWCLGIDVESQRPDLGSTAWTLE